MANLGPVFCKMSVSIWIREKTFFFGTHFHFFGHKIWPFLGVIASFPESGFHRWEIPKSGFYRGTDQFSNARMMASCSGQLFRKSGSIKLEPEFRKINTAKQWSGKMQWTIFPKLGFYRVGTPISENWPDGLLGPTKLRLSGVKMAKKLLFSNFSRSSNI